MKLTLLSLLILSALASQAARGATRPRQIPPPEPLQIIGQPVPDVTLTDMNGAAWETADLVGRPTVLYLWARWCRSCMSHIDQLQRLQSDHPDTAFYAVNVDRDEDVGRAIASRLKNLDIPVVLDSRCLLMGQLDVSAMPLFVVLDAKGVVRAKLVGYHGDETDQALANALKEAADGTH